MIAGWWRDKNMAVLLAQRPIGDQYHRQQHNNRILILNINSNNKEVRAVYMNG
jgi:hypothetical protein